ncbi:hypothetical protein AYI70_g636 [Smittium culicis]|uniref:Uncharacterized protein n=1 Tax=Smittium culicis TaxID=133412 RepID=A0A1R1YFX5_9FUNG|nr:hypothetical protein AYI70_g636 [Smittium culicis]
MLEPRMKILGETEKNGELNALQIGTNQKLKSGEYTGIGGLLKINNRHISWKLDTGAGLNVISDQLAKELGLGESRNESESAVTKNYRGFLHHDYRKNKPTTDRVKNATRIRCNNGPTKRKDKDEKEWRNIRGWT